MSGMQSGICDIFGDDDEKPKEPKKTKTPNANQQELRSGVSGRPARKKLGKNGKGEVKAGEGAEFGKPMSKKPSQTINFSAFELRILTKVDEMPEELMTLDEFYERVYSEGLVFTKATKLEEEDDYGNTEYKLKLVDHSFERIEHLTTQMRFRLEEGGGEAFYNLGYEDNGVSAGISPEDVYKSFRS